VCGAINVNSRAISLLSICVSTRGISRETRLNPIENKSDGNVAPKTQKYEAQLILSDPYLLFSTLGTGSCAFRANMARAKAREVLPQGQRMTNISI
jgi:hypothetical protein